jgi:hypothetical protein
MNHQITTDPPSYQNAPQEQVKNPAALETLLQVLSNVHSEIVLHEATTMAKEATIDTLISRFEDITSILKEAKRQRQTKRKYCGNDGMELPSLDGDDSKRTLGIPTEVLRQLTQSGFLSTADLAKTLLLTCKCYAIELGQEYVYEYFCRSRWHNITKLPPSLIADRGYYWLFRNMSRGIYESPALPSVIPPPAFDYDEMLFSISIRDGSGEEIVSEVVCADQLATFKLDGCARISLEQPIIIGTYPAVPVGAYAGYAKRDMECDNWSVTVHLFRLDQNKCCCVHDSRSCEWETETDGYLGIDEGVFVPNGIVGRANYSTGGRANYSTQHSDTLELDERGKRLEGRIKELEDDMFEFQGVQFYVHLNCFVQAQAPPHPDDPPAPTVVLEFREVQLTAIRVNSDGSRWGFVDGDLRLGPEGGRELFFDGDDYGGPDPHGVTLPHLMEHLKRWGSADD